MSRQSHHKHFSCCKTQWSNQVRSKLTISTRVCVLFPIGEEKLLWFHSGLSSKLQKMFSANHSIWSFFNLRKISSSHKPQDGEKITNNLHFHTDIYPIFPQVLFYHVRVFDVCGALQYFNVLSPPPPPPLPSPPMSDVWATMLCPRIQCSLMSQRGSDDRAHSLIRAQVTRPVTCHVSVLSLVITTGPWPWSQD